jgi:hypothetical protein
MLENKIFYFIHSSASLHCFIFLVSVLGVITINFGQYIEIFWKKYSLALHLVKIDMDLDRQALDADPDP